MCMEEIAVLRPARAGDAPALSQIYNHAVLHTTATAQEVPETLAERLAWLDDHARGNYPVLVAEAGTVVAWGSLSPFLPRSGYRYTAENSVYVHPDWQVQGLGKRLLGALVEAAQDNGFHALVALIDGGNQASLALHAAFGFTPVARMPQVYHKFGRWLDLVIMQRLLGDKEV